LGRSGAISGRQIKLADFPILPEKGMATGIYAPDEHLKGYRRHILPA
jgi:hypothetical protein